MVEKSQYYAAINGLNAQDTAPYTTNVGLAYPPVYADAINAIADGDPAFLSWKETTEATTELVELDGVLSRAEEDIVNTLINKGILTGNEPKMAYIMENITRKVAARNRL